MIELIIYFAFLNDEKEYSYIIRRFEFQIILQNPQKGFGALIAKTIIIRKVPMIRSHLSFGIIYKKVVKVLRYWNITHYFKSMGDLARDFLDQPINISNRIHIPVWF